MNKPKPIFVVVENSAYTEECYTIASEPYLVEAFESLQDAQLSLWYWGLDQIDQCLETEIDSDLMRVSSEGHDLLEEYLDRWIVQINLY